MIKKTRLEKKIKKNDLNKFKLSIQLNYVYSLINK